jgi:hypothetical protein
MRQTAKQGAKTVFTDTSHRFHCDMNRILTEHIKPDMPEELQTSMEPFAFWEEHMEAGAYVHFGDLLLCFVLYMSASMMTSLYTSGRGDIIALMGMLCT